MSKTISQFKAYTKNGLLYLFIFLGAFSIAASALSRKITSFSDQERPIVLNVVKPEIQITNTVPGMVEKVLANSGQRVQKGELLIQLSDPSAQAKLATLKSVENDNISAQTEARVLEANQTFYDIRAPQDGVIFQIFVAEGTYLNQDSPLLIMYGNDNIKLSGQVNATEYAQLSRQGTYDLFSPRFGQYFEVKLEGAGRVIPGTQYEQSRYELVFQFADNNEGVAFIQGEGLQLSARSSDEATHSLAEWLVFLINSYVKGI